MTQPSYGTVLITGTNRGLGLEFVRQFAPISERIVATCRNPGRAGELRRLAEQNPGKIEVHGLDVTDGAAIRRLAADTEGPIDLLINNAGVLAPRATSWPQDSDAWRRALEVNTIAPLKVAEAFLDAVTASRRKLIVNLTSKMASIGDNTSGGAYIYRSSKAALNAVMKSLALDTASRGVVVLLLHPGWVGTDMGGPNALIDAPTSVAGMKAIIHTAGAEHSGHFLNYDGSEIPW